MQQHRPNYMNPFAVLSMKTSFTFHTNNYINQFFLLQREPNIAQRHTRARGKQA